MPTETATKSYTVIAANGYAWRNATVAKGAKLDTSNATPEELAQLDRDSQGPNAKLSSATL